MGIDGLTKFVCTKAPAAANHVPPEGYMNRVVAIDASLSLYQFIVAIRDGQGLANLKNSEGEITSHIAGMLSRAIRIMELGMKPIYVFDGKAPKLKSGELAKRKERKATAEMNLQDAQERGDITQVKKFAGRTVTVTKQHNEDVKTLLRLMGVPIVEAPGEAEAQCASLCKMGKAFATVTEDADALCFGSPVLVRGLTFSDSKAKNPTLLEINLQAILTDLDFTMDQFIDFCILCGCDYCDTIKGIGPMSAYKLIKDNKCLENVFQNLDPVKYPVPENFPYQEARQFFKEPSILGAEEIPDLQWTDADEEALTDFLVNKQNFNADRVSNAIARLKKAKNKACSQTRLESFFSVSRPSAPVKRKLEPPSDKKSNANKKKRLSK